MQESETAIIATRSSTTEVALDVLPAEEENDHDVSDPHLIQIANINKIIKKRDLASLSDYGAQGFAEALGTDLEKGISSDDQHLCCRQIACKSSDLEAATEKGFIHRHLRSSKNCIIFLLLLSAVLSIGFGIKEEGLGTGWCEGVIILNAVVILVVFPLIRDSLDDVLQLPRKQKKEMEEREMGIDVIRGGNIERIFMSDIVVGDMVCLKTGDMIPADGLFVSGDFLELDDGSKFVINGSNPFLFYGAEVISGDGRMLVTSACAEMMSRVTPCKRTVPFGSQLDKVNTWKQIVGTIIPILIIVVVFLRFELTKQQANSGLPDVKGKPIAVNEFKDLIKRIVMKPSGKINTIATSLTLLLVGVVEGLPFCINLAIAYWKGKGIAFAQELSACVAAGSVTVICIEKTGGLTSEPLEVDKLWIGEEEMTEDSTIASPVSEALCEGISTSFLIPQALRTAAEEPLLSWAAHKFHIKLETVRQCATLVQVKEMMDGEGRGLLISRKESGDNGNMCLHWRGLATKILPKCSLYYGNEGRLEHIDEQKRVIFQQIVEHMQSTHMNKVIAFAYKETDVSTIDETGLTLLGLVGLKVSMREDIKKTIEACRKAGVRIILVSGDKAENLVKIAQQFGIFPTNPNGQKVTTGEDFRNHTDKERMEIANQILVMGNSLPSDKRLLVNFLKRNGDSVAVVGNDVPALKAADVGLVMGSWSTTIARESADIIVWDTNINFLVVMLRYGRCIHNNIQKYIQLELTMLVAGVLITSITLASTGHMPLTTIQSTWVNLVVPILAGLALLTEPPSKKLMDAPSKQNEAAVITKAMWTNIISQAIYQATILVTFHFKGQAILGINKKVKKTIIFNSFVLCQLFNQFNSRELVLQNKFRSIHKNHWFWVALCLTVVLQETFIEIAHILVGNARLNWSQWGICFLIGIVSMVIDWAEKFILGFIKD